MFDGYPAHPLSKKGAEPPSQFSANFYCAQTTGCITMPLGMEGSLSPGDCFSMGIQLPSPKRGRSPSPIFGPCLLWPNGWIDQDGTWQGGGPWCTPHCARWAPSSPAKKRGRTAPPQFWARFFCGQTAGCIKMPLGMKVGLRPGDFVLDGDPVHLFQKGAELPIFQPTSIVGKRLHVSRCRFIRR